MQSFILVIQGLYIIIWYALLPFIVHILMLRFMLMLKLLSVHKYVFRHCYIDIVFTIDKIFRTNFLCKVGTYSNETHEVKVGQCNKLLPD